MDVGQERPRTDLNGDTSLVDSFLIFGNWDMLSNTRVSRGMPEGTTWYSGGLAGLICMPLNNVTRFTSTNGCSGLFLYKPTKQSLGIIPCQDDPLLFVLISHSQ